MVAKPKRKPFAYDLSNAYVYGIIVDGVLRYVGKGRGYRMREHFRIARRLINKRETGEKIKSNLFYNRLAAAMAKGRAVDEIVFAQGLTDEQAFALEIEKIAEQASGQLWNAALGGAGFTPELARSKWTPERRAKQREVAKRRWSDPAARQLHSETIAEQWRDPNYRKNNIEKQKRRWSAPGAKERGSIAAKASWSDPALRAAQSEKQRARKSAPEERAKQSAQSLRQWSDPVFRERWSAVWAAKRAEKQRQADEASPRLPFAMARERSGAGQ